MAAGARNGKRVSVAFDAGNKRCVPVAVFTNESQRLAIIWVLLCCPARLGRVHGQAAGSREAVPARDIRVSVHAVCSLCHGLVRIRLFAGYLQAQ